MAVDCVVLILAGTLTLLILALAWLVSPYWLFQSAFTGFCRQRSSSASWG